MSVTPVSPGGQCKAGGSSIAFGLDLNGNGKLDTSEVASTTMVCNGSNGRRDLRESRGRKAQSARRVRRARQARRRARGVNSLIRQDNEPAGANCPAGGVRIESGLDLNGDGILEANEVTETSYICEGQHQLWGERVANGQNGLTSLIATTPAACRRQLRQWRSGCADRPRH